MIEKQLENQLGLQVGLFFSNGSVL